MATTKRQNSVLALLLAGALIAGGCGSSGDDDAAEGTTTVAPTTEAGAASTTEATAAATETTITPTTPAPPTSTSTELDPTADQTPPPSVNGLELDGDSLWVASISGDEVLKIDTAGTILARYPTAGAGPDDVTVGPDGAVYWTGFVNGDVGRIADGETTVLGNVGAGANPIGLTESGELIVGVAVTGDALYRMPLDGGEPELIVEPVGDMNAFGVVGEAVVGPIGGIAGPGAVISVDTATGAITPLADLEVSVTASAIGPDGLLHVLSGITGRIFTVDPIAGGPATEVAQLPADAYDNLAIAADGTIYVSSFITPTIVVVAPDGSMTTLAIGS